MKTLRLVLLLTLVCSLAAGGLVFGQAKSGGKMVWGMQEETPTLDPHGTTLASATLMWDYVFEWLFVFNDKSELVPHLCTSWEVSADQLTWDIKLKQGITFHNGDPVTAASWVYSYNRFLQKSPLAGFLSSVESFSAPDTYTLRIKLKQPYPRILEMLTLPGAVLLDQKTVEALGDRFGIDGMNGTGPFELVKWVRGEYLLLERVDSYNHGPAYLSNQGPAYLEQVEFRFIPEDSTRASELAKGKVDISIDVPFTKMDVVQQAKNVKVVEETRNMTMLLTVNASREPLNDQRVREAIAHAIGRDPLAAVALQGHGQPAYILCSPAQLGFPTNYDEVRGYYPSTNAKLVDLKLKAAGWVDTDNDGIREKDGKELKLSLWTQVGEAWGLIAQILQQQFAAEGVATEITTLDTGTFYAALAKKGVDFNLAVCESGYPFALDYMPFVHHSRAIGSSNNSWYDFDLAPKIDQWLDTAQVLPTAEERYAALAEALKLIGEASVNIPMVWPTYPIGWKTDRLGGVEEMLASPFQPDFMALDGLLYYIKQ